MRERGGGGGGVVRDRLGKNMNAPVRSCVYKRHRR